MEVRIFLTATAAIRNVGFSISVSDKRGDRCSTAPCSSGTKDCPDPGPHVVTCRIPSLPLSPGAYEMWLAVYEPGTTPDLIQWSRAGMIRIQVLEDPGPGAPAAPWRYAPLRVDHHWTLDGD